VDLQLINLKGVFFMNGKKIVGYTLATAAALTFAVVPVTSAFAADPAAVQCYGVNACKGQAQCKSAKNACKGQNSCKGTGFMSMSSDDCTKAGGTTTPA
jgi:hypothetical protein